MSSSERGSKLWNESHFPSDQLDKVGDTWGIRWRGMDKMRHGTYLASLHKILKKKESQKILDIGCALCDFTQRAWKLNKNNRFYGMDISENAINWGKKKFPMFDLKAEALPRIPFDTEFDVVFCLEVLLYLDPDGRKETIINISRSLTGSGVLMFSGVLDSRKIYHTEEEVIGLISHEFEIKEIFYNHWKIYKSLIQHPFDELVERLHNINKDISLTDADFEKLIWSSRFFKQAFLKSLRLTKPLSTFLLECIAGISNLVLSSKAIALILNELSKIVMDKNKADEIVVIATKKHS